MHLLVFPFQMQNDKGLLRFTKVCGSPFMPLTPPKNCIGLNGVDLAASVFFNLHIVSITAELFWHNVLSTNLWLLKLCFVQT